MWRRMYVVLADLVRILIPLLEGNSHARMQLIISWSIRIIDIVEKYSFL
jgi:hypothetical protein